MRATTLVKFDATHQVKYNLPLTRAVHFTAKQFHNNRRLSFHSPQGKFHRKRSLSKMTKTFFLSMIQIGIFLIIQSQKNQDTFG